MSENDVGMNETTDSLGSTGQQATPQKTAAEISASLRASEKLDLVNAAIKASPAAAAPISTAEPEVVEKGAGSSKAADKPVVSNTKSTRKRSWGLLSKRNMRTTIVIVALVLIMDVLVIGYVFASNNSSGRAEVHENPIELIHGQLDSNHGQAIATIAFNPEMTFNNYRVNKGRIKNLDNNYLTTVVDGDERKVILIDETMVSRLLAFNSDWAAYQNTGKPDVFDNILPNSQAEEFVLQHQGFKISFHKLSIGQISTDGTKYYILAQPVYTLLKNGQSITVSDVCLFTFVRQGDTLVLSEIEKVDQPSQEARSSPEVEVDRPPGGGG